MCSSTPQNEFGIKFPLYLKNEYFFYLWGCSSGTKVKVELHKDKERVSMMFSAVIAKGLAGVEHQVRLRRLALAALTFQQEFTATHPADSLVSRLRRNAAGMCSFSLYLFAGSHTHTLSPPTYSPAFFHFTHITLSYTSFFLPLAGSQIWIWLCHIRRQGQAESGQWRHHGGGFRRAAKWASHGTTVVS